MKRPHASGDVRERALAAVDRGHRVANVAPFFQNDPSTIYRWLRQRAATGSGLSRPRSGRPRLIAPTAEAAVRAQVAADPDAPLAEHRDRWEAEQPVPVSASTLRRACRRLNSTLKKTLTAQEQDAKARAVWRAAMAELDPTRLIFLDETRTPTTMTPLRARSPRGSRVVGRVPRGRWEAVTLLATLTPTGFGTGLQVTGALDRIAFDAFVTETLVPTLRTGDIVVLDNLSVHKSAVAQAAITAVGARLVFLPAYSPHFNPIELAFAKLKQRLRRVAARSVEAIMAATQAAYAQITANDARGYYRHAGYNL